MPKITIPKTPNIQLIAFFKIRNLNSLQRGSIKDSYVGLISKPVGCVKNININKLTNLIDNIL